MLKKKTFFPSFFLAPPPPSLTRISVEMGFIHACIQHQTKYLKSLAISMEIILWVSPPYSFRSAFLRLLYATYWKEMYEKVTLEIKLVIIRDLCITPSELSVQNQHMLVRQIIDCFVLFCLLLQSYCYDTKYLKNQSNIMFFLLIENIWMLNSNLIKVLAFNTFG